MPRGKITRLEPSLGFGWLVDAAGLDWFFVRDSVSGGTFDQLAPGEHVEFTPEWTAHGPRAAEIHHHRLAQML